MTMCIWTKNKWITWTHLLANESMLIIGIPCPPSPVPSLSYLVDHHMDRTVWEWCEADG